MAAIDEQIAGDHYKKMAIQPIQFITANNLGFCEGNIIKYVCRWPSKGGVEDLKKARHYIDLLIDSQRVQPVKRSVLDKPVIPMHTNPWNEVDCRSSVESGLEVGKSQVVIPGPNGEMGRPDMRCM